MGQALKDGDDVYFLLQDSALPFFAFPFGLFCLLLLFGRSLANWRIKRLSFYSTFFFSSFFPAEGTSPILFFWDPALCHVSSPPEVWALSFSGWHPGEKLW